MWLELELTLLSGGNQPGEPREARELGVKTPMDGLYLREDISFTCSAFFAGIVKKGMQDASQVMIDRMKRKAELLDQGKLHAMFEDGKLKTSKPTGPQPAMEDGERVVPSPGGSQPGSPPPQFDSPYSQQSETFKPGYTNYGSLVGRHTSQSARASYIQPNQQQQGPGGQQRPMSDMPGYAQYQQYPQNQYQQQNQQQGEQQNFVSELPGNFYQPQQADGLYPQPLKPQNPQQSFRSELPGDNTLYPDSANRRSSPQPNSGYSNQGGQQSPGYPNQSGQQSPGYANQGGQSSPGHQNQGGSNENSARSSSYQVNNPDQQQQNRASSYQITNPEQQQQQQQAGARQSSQSNIQQWQQSVQNDTPIDESYYRNSRHSHGGGSSQYTSSPQPDHQRMSNLSIQQNAPQNAQQSAQGDDRDQLPSQRTSKCPV